MFSRVSLRVMVALVAVQLVIGTLAFPCLGAERGRKVLVTPTREGISQTNLQAELSRENVLPEKTAELLKPEPGILVPGPPPRPPQPSRRMLDAIEDKKNWAFADPAKALGVLSLKDLLNSREPDADAISGTPQGFIAKYRKQADLQQSDQIEAINEVMRRLREEDTSEWTLADADPYGSASRSDSSRSQPEQTELLTPQKSLERYPSLLSPARLQDPYSIHSLYDESVSQRALNFREYLDSRIAPKPLELPKPVAQKDESEIPTGAIADFGIRPFSPLANPNAAFQPQESAVQRFLPFGNPNSFKSDLKANSGGGVLPAPTAIQPFAPLPQRRF